MTERLAPNEVLCSSVSDARFLVIGTGAADGMPSVDGVEMSRGKPQPCGTTIVPPADCDLRGGQRYVDVVTGLTLVCIRPGRGTLSFQGRRLAPERSARFRLVVA